jgi:hypothetical protein
MASSAGLPEDGLDFRIFHLRKMGIELTHRASLPFRRANLFFRFDYLE